MNFSKLIISSDSNSGAIWVIVSVSVCLREATTPTPFVFLLKWQNVMLIRISQHTIWYTNNTQHRIFTSCLPVLPSNPICWIRHSQPVTVESDYWAAIIPLDSTTEKA